MRFRPRNDPRAAPSFIARRVASTARTALLLALVGALAACGTAKKTKTLVTNMFGNDLQVEIHVDPRLNLKSPVAVELVMIQQKKLTPKVAELTARQWFEGRDQFRRDNKKGWTSHLWECVPDQKPNPEAHTVRVKSGTRNAYIFAEYLVPGPHREQVDPRQHIVLRLDEASFSIEPLD